MQHHTLTTCFPWASKQFARTFSRHSEFFLFASQNCLHTCFCICGHQTCGSSGLWVPVRCSVSQGAQSSMKMLCFQLDGLLQRARDPKRMIPSVALQRLTLAWRVAFRGRSLISLLETGCLIGWMSSVYQSQPVGRRQLHTLLRGSFERGSLVCLSSFNQCWSILMTFINYMENCVWCIDISYQMTGNMHAQSAQITWALSRFCFYVRGGFHLLVSWWTLDECLFPRFSR